jgi:hypothetical protein
MLLDRKRVVRDTAYRNEMRLQCQQDHFFLGKLLGYDKLLERVHRPAVSLYVVKNPAISIDQQRALKKTTQLDPRGTYKSTVKVVDAVQWIICFPNVRYCKFTATKDLAKAFAGEIADHFVCGKKPKDIDNPYDEAFVAEATDFQLLFPEFVITPSEKKVAEYTAPCRTINWKEKTVMAFSNETTISGWHFDVGDIDDIVDTQNSSTPPGIKKVKKNWHVNKKTFMPWAYLHFTGTRYDPFDLWGDQIDNADPKRHKFLIRGALTLKNGKRLEPGIEFPPEIEMTLLFPELLSYEFLKGEFEDDYESFMTQYMNDAYGGHEVVFTGEAMLKCTVGTEDIPVSGHHFIHWRFPFGKDKHAAAAAGLMDGIRMFVTDVMFGVFKPSNLAHHVVMMAKKYGVERVSIEDTPGARAYEAAIQNYAAASNWRLQINWLEFTEDETTRELRMKSLEPLLATSRLIFSSGIRPLKEVYRQFQHFGMVDDAAVVDVVSQLVGNLPKSVVRTEQSVDENLAWQMLQQKDLHDRTHGLGAYRPAEPILIEKPWEPQKNSYGLEEIMPGLNG